MLLIKNNLPEFRKPLPQPHSSMFNTIAVSKSLEAHRVLFDNDSTTPLRSLKNMADCFNVSALYYKDEGYRKLNSFKFLGGTYAVVRVAQNYLKKLNNKPVSFRDLKNSKYKEQLANLTVACATDGNHGRAVAYGAQFLGCKAVVYMHENVPAARENAVHQFGAETTRVKGTYDDSVAAVLAESLKNGWALVSDTTLKSFDQTVAYVMEGYNVMAYEIISSMEKKQQTLSHIFLQAGVGGMAAAMTGYINKNLKRQKPKIIIVEPENANRLLQSLQQGRAVRIKESKHTKAEMLSCYEPSHMAWEILARQADYFMDVPDKYANKAVDLLTEITKTTPSGAEGLAGFIAAHERGLHKELNINENSRILFIGSESIISPNL